MTDDETIDEVKNQVNALALALAALISNGAGSRGTAEPEPGTLAGATKAREILKAADLWPDLLK